MRDFLILRKIFQQIFAYFECGFGKFKKKKSYFEKKFLEVSIKSPPIFHHLKQHNPRCNGYI